jgi:hypothetical protein
MTRVSLAKATTGIISAKGKKMDYLIAFWPLNGLLQGNVIEIEFPSNWPIVQ